MMNPEPPLTCRCSSSSSLCGERPLPRGFRGSGKKNSNGSMPDPRLRRSLVWTISVVVIETTAGATRAATSANDGVVTHVTAPCHGWMGAECDRCDDDRDGRQNAFGGLIHRLSTPPGGVDPWVDLCKSRRSRVSGGGDPLIVHQTVVRVPERHVFTLVETNRSVEMFRASQDVRFP